MGKMITVNSHFCIKIISVLNFGGYFRLMNDCKLYVYRIIFVVEGYRIVGL